jgi:hypothetical protein
LKSRSCRGTKLRAGTRKLRAETRDIPYIAADVTRVAVNIIICKTGARVMRRRGKHLCSNIGQFAFHISVKCSLDATSETLLPRVNTQKLTLNRLCGECPDVRHNSSLDCVKTTHFWVSFNTRRLIPNARLVHLCSDDIQQVNGVVDPSC